jgi:LysM repeat protein
MKNTPTFPRPILYLFSGLLLLALACSLPRVAPASDNSQTEAGPTVAFQEPLPGIVISLGDSFPVLVMASDPLGVVRLDLWADDTLLMSQPAQTDDANGVTPLILNYALVGVQPGTYTLVARAYNSAGVLGESLALPVTVAQGAATTTEPKTVLYVAQDGDTIESISQATGSSPDAIRQANPGINNLSPGQAVAVPGAHPAQPSPPAMAPAQPPSGAANQILPGLLPVAQNGAVDIAPGAIPHLAPSLFPGFQSLSNSFDNSLTPPSSLTTSVSNCSVNLSWADNSSGENAFVVYRRMIPDQVAPQRLQTLPPNQTSFIDRVPVPGKYEYAVEAEGASQMLPAGQNSIEKNIVPTSRSAPVSVQVQPSVDCMQDPAALKYVHIQILNVTLKSSKAGDTPGIALWYSINGSPGRRVPETEGSYNPSGAWHTTTEVVPVSSSLLLDPNNPIIIKFWGIGSLSWFSKTPPIDLQEAFNAHLANDVSGKADNYYIAENANFKVEYKFWVEDAHWTAQGTTNAIPTPTNLRILRTTSTSRVLTWDWNGKASAIDGYILYRSYSCPGMDTQTYAPQMVPWSSPPQTEVVLKGEPVGCVYRYYVSAYGRVGESGASNAISGDTQAAYGVAGITFTKIKFNSLPYDAGGVQIDLYANQLHRTTDAYWIQNNSSYDLANWVINGLRPNHSLSMPLGEREFLTIGFSVSGVDSQGYVAQDSVCRGGSIVLPLSTWQQKKQDLTIRSSDGSCELSVQLSSDPTLATSGSIVRPQADVVVSNLGLIGDKFFVYVENKGPDDLPNNSFFLYVTNGYKCTNSRDIVYSYDDRKVYVQSNLPQWIYLNEWVDKDYKFDMMHRTDNWFPEPGCDAGFFAWTSPIDESRMQPEAPDFTDPNPDDVLFLPLDQIQPVK